MQMRQVLWMRDMGDSLTEEKMSIGVAPLVAVEYAFPVLLDTTKESLECLLDPDYFLMNNTNQSWAW